MNGDDTSNRDTDLWPGSAPREATPSQRPSHFARGAASVVTLFVVLLVVVGAATILRRPGSAGAFLPLPTPTAHATAVASTATPQIPMLTWRKESLPANAFTGAGAGQSPFAADAAFAVAPSNGDVAYICQTPATGAPHVWRTLDAGQSWTKLPDPPDGGFQSCGLLIDQNDSMDPLVSFATVPYLSDIQISSGYAATYTLVAGGAQWRQLNGGPVAFNNVSQFASWHGDYYATFGSSTPTSLQSTLSVSTDGMRTWRPIDHQIVVGDTLAPSGETGEIAFWVQPVTGALLAKTYNSVRTGELWYSSDQGANWQEVVLPPSPVSEVGETGDWVTGASIWAQYLTAGQTFQICVWFTEGRDRGAKSFYCSHNRGQTWVKAVSPQAGIDLPLLMLTDGALLAESGPDYFLTPGCDPHLATERDIGSLPASILSGNSILEQGATARGVTIWQPDSALALYVAQYSVGNS